MPLVLFVGFLSIKPPAIGSDATPTGVTSPESIQSPTNSDQSQLPDTSKPPVPTAKPSILGGDGDGDGDGDDDDDDDDDDEKPSYGGHDDDDYDD